MAVDWNKQCPPVQMFKSFVSPSSHHDLIPTLCFYELISSQDNYWHLTILNVCFDIWYFILPWYFGSVFTSGVWHKQYHYIWMTTSSCRPQNSWGPSRESRGLGCPEKNKNNLITIFWSNCRPIFFFYFICRTLVWSGGWTVTPCLGAAILTRGLSVNWSQLLSLFPFPICVVSWKR